MEFDKMYVFKSEDLKKEAKSAMIPFSFIFPVVDAEKMILVDGQKPCIKFQTKTLNFVIVFSNIIECWKFYYYGRILHYNAKEFVRSLQHQIDVNMRILLDDYRQSMISTVLASMIGINNLTANKMLAEKTKTFIDEEQINFPALTNLYERMLIAFYSMDGPNKEFDKLKVITDQFHRYYFLFIKDLFSNPYTDVN